MSALDFPEGSGRRILALARAHGWRRVRRSTVVWIASGPVMSRCCVRAVELWPAHPWVAVGALTLSVLIVLGFVFAGREEAPAVPPHLPFLEGERALATLLAETATALGSLGLVALFWASWLGVVVLLVGWFPDDPVGPSWVSDTLDQLLSLPREAAAVVALLFVALAPTTIAPPFAARKPATCEQWTIPGFVSNGVFAATITAGAVVVSAAWLVTGQPLVAVFVAVGLWSLVPRTPGTGSDRRRGDVAVASGERLQVGVRGREVHREPLDIARSPPIDRGLVPLLGWPALWRQLGVLLVGIGITSAMFGLVIEAARWWRPNLPNPGVFVPACTVVTFLVLHLATWRLHPERSVEPSRADDLVSFQRHLPVHPRPFIDGVWVVVALQGSLGVIAGVTGMLLYGLDAETAVAVVAGSVATALVPAISTWWHTAMHSRAPAARPALDALPHSPATVFAVSAFAASIGFLMSVLGPMRILVPAALLLLVLALATWAWARHRWST